MASRGSGKSASHLKKPLPRQREAIDDLKSILRDDGAALLIGATGAGKTGCMIVTAWERAQEIEPIKPRVLFLTHRVNLLDQSIDEASSWVDCRIGVFASTYGGDQQVSTGVNVAMVETLRGKLDQISKYSVVVIDECHHAAGTAQEEDEAQKHLGDYAKVLRALQNENPQIEVLGGTANMRRAQGLMLPILSDARKHQILYADLAFDPDNLRLVPPRTIRYSKLLPGGRSLEAVYPELGRPNAKVNMPAIRQRVAEARGSEDFWTSVVDDWRAETGKVFGHNHQPKTLAFCDTLNEALRLTAAYVEMGNAAASISYKDSPAQQTELLDRFRRGEIKTLVSCKIIGEGTDIPETDVIVAANKLTTHPWMDQLDGRKSRIAPGKRVALGLDYGLTSWVHGRREDRMSLEVIERLVNRDLGDAAEATALGLSWDRVPGRLLGLDDIEGRSPYLVLGSAERSWLAVERSDGKFNLWNIERRVAGANGGRRFGSRLADESAGGKRPVAASDLLSIYRDELDRNWSWFARGMEPVTRHGVQVTRSGVAAIDDLLSPLGAVRDLVMAPVVPGMPEVAEKPAEREAKVRILVERAKDGTPESADAVAGYIRRVMEKNGPPGAREAVILSAVALAAIGQRALEGRGFDPDLQSATGGRFGPALHGAGIAVGRNIGRKALQSMEPVRCRAVASTLANAAWEARLAAGESAPVWTVNVIQSLRKLLTEAERGIKAAVREPVRNDARCAE